LHLLDDPLELVGLLARWERRPFLRECNSAKEEEGAGASSEGFHCYLSGRMALWAALTSWSGNTPRIRTATDATKSTAMVAGDVTTRTLYPGVPAVSPGSRMYMTMTTRR